MNKTSKTSKHLNGTNGLLGGGGRETVNDDSPCLSTFHFGKCENGDKSSIKNALFFTNTLPFESAFVSQQGLRTGISYFRYARLYPCNYNGESTRKLKFYEIIFNNRVSTVIGSCGLSRENSPGGLPRISRHRRDVRTKFCFSGEPNDEKARTAAIFVVVVLAQPIGILFGPSGTARRRFGRGQSGKRDESSSTRRIRDDRRPRTPATIAVPRPRPGGGYSPRNRPGLRYPCSTILVERVRAQEFRYRPGH